MLSLKRLLGSLKLGVKVAVKLLQNILPVALALLNAVERVLHSGGELHIGNIREALYHKLRNNLAEHGGLEVFALFDHIFARGYRADGRRVGAWTSYALFLHRAYERCLCITGGRLSKLLLPVTFLKLDLLSLGKVRQWLLALGSLLVLAFLVNGGVAGKLYFRVVSSEKIAR